MNTATRSVMSVGKLDPFRLGEANVPEPLYLCCVDCVCVRRVLVRDLVFLNPSREEYSARVMYINRNPDIFRDIVKHMQGYFVAAKDEVHLENLVTDAYFFKLKRLIENLRQTM